MAQEAIGYFERALEAGNSSREWIEPSDQRYG